MFSLSLSLSSTHSLTHFHSLSHLFSLALSLSSLSLLLSLLLSPLSLVTKAGTSEALNVSFLVPVVVIGIVFGDHLSCKTFHRSMG
jgi:hypothetical protein